jgi:hypothetical protein
MWHSSVCFGYESIRGSPDQDWSTVDMLQRFTGQLCADQMPREILGNNSG